LRDSTDRKSKRDAVLNDPKSSCIQVSSLARQRGLIISKRCVDERRNPADFQAISASFAVKRLIVSTSRQSEK
jgi:hypothetical protein